MCSRRGLRSFTQIAHIVEPNTGNLTVETVRDLTRRASQLDMVRTVGQMGQDLALVGSGSVGLVYRGRIAEGGAVVCVKFMVSRGADAWTEGLLSRALVHPNVIVTVGWHATRVTAESFMDLPDALTAMAMRDKRKSAKAGRRSTAVGKGRGGAGKRRAATAGSTLSNGPSGTCPASACPSGSTGIPGNHQTTGTGGEQQQGASVPLPHLNRSVGERGGGSDRLPLPESRRKSFENHKAGTFTAHVLDMVLGAASAGGAAGRSRAASPHGSPLSRLGGSMHRSFTSLQTRARAGVLAECTRLAHGSHHFPAAPQHGQHGVMYLNPPGLQHAPSSLGPRTHFEGSWSVRRGEPYGTISETASTLQHAAQYDIAAAAASAAAGSGLLAASGTIQSWFLRDSLGSQGLGPSPNPSNHNPSSHRRSPQDALTRGDGSGHHAGHYGTYAAYGLGAAPQQPLGPAAAGVLPSAPVAIAGAASRSRAVLTRAGSRLAIATTPGTQPSIPEDTQEADLMGGGPGHDAGLCAGRGVDDVGEERHAVDGVDDGPISFGLMAAPAGSRAAQRHLSAQHRVANQEREESQVLLRGMLTSADVPRSGPGAGLSGRQPGLGESVGGSSAGDGSPMLSISSLRLQPTPASPLHGPRSQHYGGSWGRPPLGLLATALAAHGASLPAGPPTVALLGEMRPNGNGHYTPTMSRSISRSMSTALALTRTTTSSKRFSSTATVPGLVLHSVPAQASAGAALATNSAILSTPSGHGSGLGLSTPTFGEAPTSGLGASGGATTSATATVMTSPEDAATKPETLERGWGLLQHIMHRLNARPGDYLMRIVMENADQGSLLHAVKSGRFDVMSGQGVLQTLLLTALDVARGMAFLHGHNVIHGDLKPSNVLLVSSLDDPRGFVAKVSDFGLSRILPKDNESVHNPAQSFPAGTVAYMAPETVNGSSFKASDVWSYGVVLWQLVTGETVPWPGLRNVQIIMGIMQGDLRLTIPPTAYPPLAHLIECCLTHDHAQRPSFGDIVLRLEAMVRDLARKPQPPQAAPSSGSAHCSTPADASLANSALDTAAESLAGTLSALPDSRHPGSAASRAVPRRAATIASIVPSDAGQAPGTVSPSLAPSLADEAVEDLPQTASEATSGARELDNPTLMARPSTAYTSASLTAPGASSNQLVHMSSSWAATTEREHRSSGWQSSALQNTVTANHFAGFGGASSLGCSAGVSNSTGTMLLERQCLQDLYSRPRESFESAAAADEVGPAGVAGAGGQRPYNIYTPLTAAFLIGGSGSGVPGRTPAGAAHGSTAAAGAGVSVAGHGGHASHHGLMWPTYIDVNMMLPMVQEEPATGSGGCPSSSRASSMAPAAGLASYSYDLRRHGSTGAVFTTGPAGEGTLPSMLRAGLLVLGSREARSSKSTSASQRQQSSSSHHEAGSSRPDESITGGAIASSGHFDPRLSSRFVNSSGHVEYGDHDGMYGRASAMSAGAMPLPGDPEVWEAEADGGVAGLEAQSLAGVRNEPGGWAAVGEGGALA
ncbi:hypothetical protein GPECTOR_1g292 [Gonium pectorale]|uniref:Protein kinase domain-containing protein n=1 Tax=Gonium pectorale TaxID=33097 RepID=A0A150H2M9_GONPE|nr:hypothetical protein GPECTOR_1g292 [Gonium pectorale]|eukprot:KXZ56331.1 hypothetical protein GPECTOR_1g292 [Gonium pectorale]